MRSIAVMNQKGGVGKTTTVVNLGAALAETGLRVCLVDLDPQAHTSMHLKLDISPSQPSIYNVLTGDISIAEVRRPVAENLSVVGSNLDLAAAESASNTLNSSVQLRWNLMALLPRGR